MYMHMQTVRVHSISKKLMYFNVICNFIPGLLYFSLQMKRKRAITEVNILERINCFVCIC